MTPTPPEGPQADELEEVTGTRALIVSLDQETGRLDIDTNGWANWEVAGVIEDEDED